MTDTNTPDTVAAAEPKMFKIKLNRLAKLYDFIYRPAFEHIVDEATLKALGDAVDHAEPV